ncbi:MAG: SOS response-associated peptidase family protein [Chlorobaculum sp.]
MIPASGFYEWKLVREHHKEPWYIHRKDSRPVGLASLWDEWLPLLFCTIITTGANREMRPVHDRMPVILERRGVGWLAGSTRQTGTPCGFSMLPMNR